MTRTLLGGILICVFWGMPGWGSTSIRAEERKSTKFKVVPKEGKERVFDLSNEAQAEQLAEMVKKGELDLVIREEKPNLLELRWDLGLWTLVVFVLLFFILRKLAWKPILEGLQKREESILKAVEDAQRARDEAQRLRDQLQREVDRAQEKVRDILDEGRRHAQQVTDEMIAKARAEIQAERERLRREIEMARDQALQELWKQAADLATMISAKAIRRQLSAEDHRRLVDEALTELQGATKAGRG
jgi:F-type H+-transporting ATPase subunit b